MRNPISGVAACCLVLAAAPAFAQPDGIDPRVARLVGQVSDERMAQTLARRAGYRVSRGEAWGPDWQHAVFTGPITQFVLPDASIDEFVFGVAAVGADGSESLVSAYVNPPPAESIVKTT